MIDFAALERPASPNTYLVCDADLTSATPDRDAPRFALSPEALRDVFLEMIDDEPRLTRAAFDEASLHCAFVQRTALLRFADDIDVKFAAAEGGSRLCVYSRSRIGWSDLGTNRKRVETWLSKLDAAVKRSAP